MPTKQKGFVIGQREQAQISAYCEIAKVNKSLLTLDELAELTGADATAEEFADAWRDNRFLASRFTLESGYVVERGKPDPASGAMAEDENRGRAAQNAVRASELADLCRGRGVRLIAISGGNSYRSARRGDDIDLFCVTARDSMWLFMLKALLLSRLYRLISGSPPFCFSYVMEEERAYSEFSRQRDALFARDALSARVLVGEGFYRRLVGTAPWMKDYFPALYARRTSGEAPEEKHASRGMAALNRLLYLTVGSYVRMKAAVLNRRYRLKGQSSAVFQASVGADHCVYESNRYRRLRRMYEELGRRGAEV